MGFETLGSLWPTVSLGKRSGPSWPRNSGRSPTSTRGDLLPAPYDDIDQLTDLLYRSGSVTSEVTITAGPAEPAPIDTGVVAAAAVQGAADPDPFAAALRAAEAASWREPDPGRFAAWLRTRLPPR